MIGVEECVNDAMSLINKFINWGARLARPCESAGLAAVVAWRQVHHSWRNFRPSPVRKKHAAVFVNFNGADQHWKKASYGTDIVETMIRAIAWSLMRVPPQDKESFTCRELSCGPQRFRKLSALGKSAFNNSVFAKALLT